MMRNTRRPRGKRLGLESLESRRLLAVAAFEAELYSDNDGVPGELLVDNTVTAGDTFFVRITAQEFDRVRRGIQSAGVNVDWDAGLLSVVESDFQLENVVTPDLPALRGGSLDNQLGTITDLSGMALLSTGAGRAIGNTGAETFATIRMQAGNTPGVATIDLSKSQESHTITLPGGFLREQHLRFDTESIVIASAEPVDASRLAELEDPANTLPETNSDDEAPQAKAVTPTPPQQTSNAITRTPQELPSSSPMTNSSPTEAIDSDDQRPLNDSETESSYGAGVDAVLSFDLNRDGIFDFGDFGLLNLHSAPAAAGATAPDSAEAEPEIADKTESTGASVEPDAYAHQFCLAAPPAEQTAAVQAWLSTLARAWAADADVRQQRRASTLF